ncbi:unnamed protein product [Spirodela intermedia]|uniref:Uncharacterized protein n=1 Tax=Spirodela intermedia TaxID=51605 RepID=A0A7I8K663_SPIIN|nr:unnamed protein product [Spirodela intermedia]
MSRGLKCEKRVSRISNLGLFFNHHHDAIYKFLSSYPRNKVVSSSCHLAERKNGDFVALWRLSPDGEELDGGGAHVRDFILRSAQQEEALHRIWYALRRWRLISRRIVLFSTTACSSINQR